MRFALLLFLSALLPLPVVAADFSCHSATTKAAVVGALKKGVTSQIGAGPAEQILSAMPIRLQDIVIDRIDRDTGTIDCRAQLAADATKVNIARVKESNQIYNANILAEKLMYGGAISDQYQAPTGSTATSVLWDGFSYRVRRLSDGTGSIVDIPNGAGYSSWFAKAYQFGALNLTSLNDERKESDRVRAEADADRLKAEATKKADEDAQIKKKNEEFWIESIFGRMSSEGIELTLNDRNFGRPIHFECTLQLDIGSAGQSINVEIIAFDKDRKRCEYIGNSMRHPHWSTKPPFKLEEDQAARVTLTVVIDDDGGHGVDADKVIPTMQMVKLTKEGA